MNHRAIFEELLDLLSRCHVEIRMEPMGGGGGGFCEIGDRKVFFYDTQSNAYECAVQAGRAVLQIIKDPETIFIKPAVRDFLDRIKEMD